MLFTVTEQLKKRREADLIVLPFWQKPKKSKQLVKPAAVIASFEEVLQPALEAQDFEAAPGQTLLIYCKGEKENRILLLGLGKEEELSMEVLRKAYSNVVKECQKKKIGTMNVVVPTVSELRRINVEECLHAISEGILLTNYRWEKMASLDEETVLLKSVCLVGVLPKLQELIHEREQIAEGVYLARDLINGNADIVTPQYLAEAAKNIAQKFSSVKATIFDQKRIEKKKWGFF